MKRIPIEDSFDLHSFLPRDLANVLSDYLEEARKRGWREVRIIHGKGKGIRRSEVRRFLASDPNVLEFFDAPPNRGGTGATIALLVSSSR
jgi:DNA-nicking Smr family endonuclease